MRKRLSGIQNFTLFAELNKGKPFSVETFAPLAGEADSWRFELSLTVVERGPEFDPFSSGRCPGRGVSLLEEILKGGHQAFHRVFAGDHIDLQSLLFGGLRGDRADAGDDRFSQ